ncbi:hypothetical protein AB0N17_21085 [Streptomyces sp. NPDC051133]|uniref:hypothetical protein n=1 Tax=Streptomyces sp. NPDC051133 TaxID=3155521 RepID=UPI00341AE353
MRHRLTKGGRGPGRTMAVGALCVSASAVLLGLAPTAHGSGTGKGPSAGLRRGDTHAAPGQGRRADAGD